MEPIVHVEDLTLSYQDHPVVWDVDLDIARNSRTAIIGPNGAGKSTLMRGILGLMKPISGVVEIMGLPPKKASRHIAYIPQSAGVNWDFPTNVLDVVLMGRYKNLGWFRRPGKEDVRAAVAALERMEMAEYKTRRIAELSGGQRQRVFLARALAGDAEVYFMDEPLAGVDMTTERIIMDTIREFQTEGKTIVAVHHDLTTLPKYFDHVAIINRRIVAAGPMEETLTQEHLDRAYRKKVAP